MGQAFRRCFSANDDNQTHKEQTNKTSKYSQPQGQIVETIVTRPKVEFTEYDKAQLALTSTRDNLDAKMKRIDKQINA